MQDLTSYDAVQVWLESAGMADEDAALKELAQFSELIERNPDEMIDDCLKLVQAGSFKLRGKTRRRYVEKIEEFENSRGGRHHGNAIRSFFIHNGVPIQPPILG